MNRKQLGFLVLMVIVAIFAATLYGQEPKPITQEQFIAVQGQAFAQGVQSQVGRIHELEARVGQLEAELKAMATMATTNTKSSQIPSTEK